MREPDRVHTLLLECLRPGGGPGPGLPRLGAPEWQVLTAEAIRQGVGPRLHAELAGRQAVAVREPEAARLRDVYLHSHLRNRAVLEQLRGIGALARAADCPLIPLKGAHLVRHIYRDPAVRPMLDLDLLVRPGDVAAVRSALVADGYRGAADSGGYSAHHHLEPLSKSGCVDVEIHRDLAPRDAPFRVDLEALWSRCTVDAEFPSLLRMAADDLLLHLCTHAAFNDRFRVGLLASCDIDATVRHLEEDLDWQRLAETANADGRARFAYVSLRLAAQLLRAPIPPFLWRALTHTHADDAVVAHGSAAIFDRARDVAVTVRRVADAEGYPSKLAALARGVFPPLAELRGIYGSRRPRRLDFLWYAWRPFDLLFRRGGAAVALMAGRPLARSKREREARRRAIGRWIRGVDS